MFTHGVRTHIKNTNLEGTCINLEGTCNNLERACNVNEPESNEAINALRLDVKHWKEFSLHHTVGWQYVSNTKKIINNSTNSLDKLKAKWVANLEAIIEEEWNMALQRTREV